ncbi:M24 family metallopeptidase [Pseudonocardia nigra]|uniref:M24 family metallopeptidase n=1 Tax=Pseudonocardia nigra TaxID=1921578 RepID=UPI001C5D56E8|nr:M24 family metallopeptidase [Pseudonocardia nigra]
MGADLTEQLDRLTALGRELGVSTVVLREQASLSWLLGCRSHVPQTLDAACFDVVVDLVAATLTVVTNAIEAPRLRDTELADVDAEWTVVPWWEARDAALPTGPAVAADRPYADVTGAGRQIAALRRTLTAHQAALLRTVCADAAAATTAAAGRISPGTTEYAAAGVLAAELLERALDPVVLLVAGDARMAAHRHPLPTPEPLGRRAMLVCCARRHGLIASVTRTVVFDGVHARERAAYTRLLQVERAFLDATAPGARLGDVVAAGTAAYAAHGFDPHEWHRHHQGGFSGWQPREYPAHPGSTDVVPAGSVVAWNPSGDGGKVEDTCLVGPDGPVPLVDDGVWPTVTVGGRPRPDLLERP